MGNDLEIINGEILELSNGDRLEFVKQMPIPVYRDMRKKIRRLEMSLEKGQQGAIMELPEPVDYFERLCIRWNDKDGNAKNKTLNELDKLQNFDDYRLIEKKLEDITSVYEDTESELGKA